jgi:hypothetical protein
MNGRDHDIADELQAQLAAVADGTLPSGRADAVLREAAASQDLTRRLERQRNAVATLRELDVRAPDALRDRVTTAAEASVRRRPRLSLRLPSLRPLVLAGGGLAAIAAVVVLALVLTSGGGTAAPTVAQAAPLALRAATAGAPALQPGGHELVASNGGITYPTFGWIGWHPTGQRTDTIGGRTARTVFYADRGGARIGYTIVDGRTLAVSGGRVVAARGSHVRLLEVNGAYVVTWQRKGHTCIVAGRGVAPARLAALASYEI